MEWLLGMYCCAFFSYTFTFIKGDAQRSNLHFKRRTIFCVIHRGCCSNWVGFVTKSLVSNFEWAIADVLAFGLLLSGHNEGNVGNIFHFSPALMPADKPSLTPKYGKRNYRSSEATVGPPLVLAGLSIQDALAVQPDAVRAPSGWRLSYAYKQPDVNSIQDLS